MNEKTTQNEFLTLSDLLKFIWARKIMVAIISVATALLLTVIVVIVNPKLEKLSFDVQVSFNSDNAQTYPNKDFYDYLNTVDATYLYLTVEKGDGKYDNIDIDDMINKNDITVLLIEQPSVVSGNTVNQTLRLTVKTSYFENEDYAQSFVKDLIDIFESQVRLNDNYNVIDSFVRDKDKKDDIYTYQDVIYSMENEYYTLMYYFDTLISQNNNLLYTGSGTYKDYNVRELRQLLDSKIAELQHIKYSLHENGYYKNLNTITIKATQLEEEVAKAEKFLEVIKDSSGQLDPSYLNSVISQWIRDKKNLDFFNDILDPNSSFGENTPSASFITSYSKHINDLEELSGVLNSLYRKHMNSRVMIRFINNRNGESTGSISPVLAIIGGLVLGFGVSSIVAVNLENKKRNKTVS